MPKASESEGVQRSLPQSLVHPRLTSRGSRPRTQTGTRDSQPSGCGTHPPNGWSCRALRTRTRRPPTMFGPYMSMPGLGGYKPAKKVSPVRCPLSFKSQYSVPDGTCAIGKEMPHAGVYVLASLISGVSAALILASGPSYTEPRSHQGTVYNVKRGQSTDDGCRASPCQIAYRMYLLTLLPLPAAEYVYNASASKFCAGFLPMGTLATSSFSHQAHGGQYALPPKGS
jgi:hypothetical protein